MTGPLDDLNQTKLEPFVVTITFQNTCSSTIMDPFNLDPIDLQYNDPNEYQDAISVPHDSQATSAGIVNLCGTREVSILDSSGSQPPFISVVIDA